MRTIARATVPALLVALALAPGAEAVTMYSYSGDTFRNVSGIYTTADHIQGWLTLEDVVPPPVQVTSFLRNVTAAVVDYSFTDGHQTLTPGNAAALVWLPVVTNGGPLVRDLNGDLSAASGWELAFTTATGMIGTKVLYDDRVDLGSMGQDFGRNGRAGIGPSDGSQRGVWTVQTVPEPSTLILVTAGLLVVGGARRFYRS